MSERGASDFEERAKRAAGQSSNPLVEFRYFLGRTKKYWMIPILLTLLAAGALVFAGGSAFAPLIYTLF